MSEEKKKFKEKISTPTDIEKVNQEAADNKTAEEVVKGRQEFKIEELGTIVFLWPELGLLLQGDMLAAKFRTEHLRKGDLLTEAQLKAIYKVPTVVKVDGKDIEIGSGIWTEKEEREMEELPSKIDNQIKFFDDFRNEIQEIETKLLELSKATKNKAKRKTLEDKKEHLTKESFELYKDLAKNRLKLLELQNKRVSLFATSLEEQANFEKIKLYAPKCILIKDEDGNEKPLWENYEVMSKANGEYAIRVFSLFSLFLRGGDVRFFIDMQEGEML